MSDEIAGTERTTEAEPPEGDFFRGGTSVVVADTNTRSSNHGFAKAARTSVPTPIQGLTIAFCSSLILAVIVAWSTVTSPFYGSGVAILAIFGIVAATVLAYKLGELVGRNRPWTEA